jgi:hypothetical protein
MKNYSIIKLLKQDKCFCKKTNDEITLNDCKLFNCSRKAQRTGNNCARSKKAECKTKPRYSN